MIAELERALAVLRAGGVVAAPTESMFGLLADATSTAAIDRLLAVKPRGPEKGMPLLLPSRAAWPPLVAAIPPLASRLADSFWPGPLTIALPAASGVDPRLTLDGSLAVRLPAPSAATELARALGRPLTATSANPPGEPATADPGVVGRWFEAELARGDLALVAVAAPGGDVSTVVVVTGDSFRIVRAGAIGREAIELALA